MLMFAILDKANPDTGNIRGLNLAAVKHCILYILTTGFLLLTVTLANDRPVLSSE
jgi:hypothetical protein